MKTLIIKIMIPQEIINIERILSGISGESKMNYIVDKYNTVVLNV